MADTRSIRAESVRIGDVIVVRTAIGTVRRMTVASVVPQVDGPAVFVRNAAGAAINVPMYLQRGEPVEVVA